MVATERTLVLLLVAEVVSKRAVSPRASVTPFNAVRFAIRAVMAVCSFFKVVLSAVSALLTVESAVNQVVDQGAVINAGD